jgi:xanthine dehydrogenase accessory factor
VGGEKIFLQVHVPPPRLIVVGAVHIAQALVPMAAMTGYDVAVVDPRRAFGSDARFPNVQVFGDWPDEALAKLAPDRGTAVVTLTHDPKLDDPALGAALKSDCFYVGALGSKRTHEKRLARLGEMGFGPADFARIHGPVGLSIGARSPSEIAISIMAQITQVRRGGAKPA